jgi:hypothetical protein
MLDLVNAASPHLQARIKRIAEALCIRRIESVIRSESALLAVQRSYEDLSTLFKVEIVVLQFFALEALDEGAQTTLQVPGQQDRIVGPLGPAVGRKRAVSGNEHALVFARQGSAPACQ